VLAAAAMPTVLDLREATLQQVGPHFISRELFLLQTLFVKNLHCKLCGRDSVFVWTPRARPAIAEAHTQRL
jgi:hypothetical protein